MKILVVLLCFVLYSCSSTVSSPPASGLKDTTTVTKEDVNTPDKIKWTPLVYASFKGDTKEVDRLIKLGANVNYAVPGRHDSGGTSLMVAAGAGHAEVCKILLDNKADFKMRESLGWTALMYAHLSALSNPAKGQPVMDVLATAGASMDQKEKEVVKNMHAHCRFEHGREEGFLFAGQHDKGQVNELSSISSRCLLTSQDYLNGYTKGVSDYYASSQNTAATEKIWNDLNKSFGQKLLDLAIGILAR